MFDNIIIQNRKIKERDINMYINKKFSGFIKTLSLFTTFGTLMQTIPYNVLASAGNSDEDIMLILENLEQGNAFENFKKLQPLLETGVIDQAILGKNIGLNDVESQYQNLASFAKIANQLEQNTLDEESVNDFNSKSDQYKDIAKTLKNTIVDLGTQAVMDKAIKSKNITTVDKKVNEDVAIAFKTALLKANDPQGSAITVIANINGDTISSNSFIAEKVGNLVEVVGKGLTNFSSESYSNIASTVSDFSESVNVNNVAKAVVAQIDDKVDSKFSDVLVNELSYSFEKNGVRNLNGNISDLTQNAINLYQSMKKLNYDFETTPHEQIQKDLQPELSSMDTAVENFVKQSYESSFSEQLQNISDNINSVQESVLKVSQKIKDEGSNDEEIKDSIDAINEQLKNAKNECSKYNGHNSQIDNIKSKIENLESDIQNIQDSYNDKHDIKEFNERISSVQQAISDISNNIIVLATVKVSSAPSGSDQVSSDSSVSSQDSSDSSNEPKAQSVSSDSSGSDQNLLSSSDSSVSDQAPSNASQESSAPLGSSQELSDEHKKSSNEITKAFDQIIKNLNTSVEQGDCIPVKKNKGKIEYTVSVPYRKIALEQQYQELQKSKQDLEVTFIKENKPKVLMIDEIKALTGSKAIEKQIENHQKIKDYLKAQKVYNDLVIEEMNQNIESKVKNEIKTQYGDAVTIDTSILVAQLKSQAKAHYKEIEGYLEIVDFTCGKDNVKWQLDIAINTIDDNIQLLEMFKNIENIQNTEKNVGAETFDINKYIECLKLVKNEIENKYTNISPLVIMNRWITNTGNAVTINKEVTDKEIDIDSEAEVLETYNIIKYNLCVAELYKQYQSTQSGTSGLSISQKFNLDQCKNNVLKAIYDLDKGSKDVNELTGYIKTKLEYQNEFSSSVFSNEKFINQFCDCMKDVSKDTSIDLRKNSKDNRSVEGIEAQLLKNKTAITKFLNTPQQNKEITDFLTVSKIGASIGYFYDEIQKNDKNILIKYTELSEAYKAQEWVKYGIRKVDALKPLYDILTLKIATTGQLFQFIKEQGNEYILEKNAETALDTKEDEFKKIIQNLDNYYETDEKRKKTIGNDLKSVIISNIDAADEDLQNFLAEKTGEKVGQIVECLYKYMKSSVGNDTIDPYQERLNNIISSFESKKTEEDMINGIIKDSFTLMQKDINENDSMKALINLMHQYYNNIVEDTIQEVKSKESSIIMTSSETSLSAEASGIPAAQSLSAILGKLKLPTLSATTGIPKLSLPQARATTVSKALTKYNTFNKIDNVDKTFHTNLNQVIANFRNQVLIFNKKSYSTTNIKNDFKKLLGEVTPNSAICAIKEVLDFSEISKADDITRENFKVDIFTNQGKRNKFNAMGISEQDKCVNLIKTIYETYNDCISDQNQFYLNLGEFLNNTDKIKEYTQTFEKATTQIKELNDILNIKEKIDKLIKDINAFIREGASKAEETNKFVNRQYNELYALLSAENKKTVDTSIKSLEDIREKYKGNATVKTDNVETDQTTNVETDQTTVEENIKTVKEKLSSAAGVEYIEKYLTDIYDIYNGLSDDSKSTLSNKFINGTKAQVCVDEIKKILDDIKNRDNTSETGNKIKTEYQSWYEKFDRLKTVLTDLKEKEKQPKDPAEKIAALKELNNKIDLMIKSDKYKVVKYVKYQYENENGELCGFKCYNDAVKALVVDVEAFDFKIAKNLKQATNTNDPVVIYNIKDNEKYETYNKDIEQWYTMIDGAKFDAQKLTGDTNKKITKEEDIDQLDQDLIVKYYSQSKGFSKNLTKKSTEELTKEIETIKSALSSVPSTNTLGNSVSTQAQNNILGNSALSTERELEILNGEEQQNHQSQTQVIDEKKAQIISNLSNLMDTYCLDAIINFLKSGNQTEANNVIVLMNNAKTAVCSNNISEIKDALNAVLDYRLQYIKNYIPYYEAKNLASTILADDYQSNLSIDDRKRAIIIDFLYSQYAIDNNFDFARCINNSDNILILIQNLGKQLYSHGDVKQADIFDSVLYKDEAKTQIDKDGIDNMNLAAVVMRMIESDENNKTLIDYTLDDLINEFEKIKIS